MLSEEAAGFSVTPVENFWSLGDILMNRKALLLSFMLLALLAVVPAAFTQDTVTIEIWDFQQSDLNILEAQEAAIAAFEEANPGIEVNVTVFPIQEYRDRLLVAVQSGEAPDMATLDQIWMAEFAASGSIIPLDSYIEASGVNPDDFFPGAWGSNVWNDQTWGVPLNNDVWEQMYFNRDLFEAAGLDPDDPPNTWPELLEACRALTNAPDQYGIALMGSGEFITVTINSFIQSNGGSILNEDGTEAALNSAESVEAIEYYRQIAEECAPPGTANRIEPEAIGLFTAGQAAIGFFGSWQQDTFRNTELNWDVAMMPVPEEGDTFHGTLGGWNMAIFAGSEHPDETWAYVEFLTGKDPQKTVNSLIPARLDAGREFIDEGREGADVIFDTVNNGFPRPLSAVYPAITQAQQDMMARVWEGEDVQAAADFAAEEINEALMDVQ
jgi:ABC-type glycerol-3-phosphate transport system substrate-binding protein